MRRERPAVVIHAAAYTAVDAAEADAGHGRGGERPRHGARGRGGARSGRAAAASSRPISCSTARSGRPYAPGDEPQPLGVYGRTKLAGEREAVRSAGRPGAHRAHGLGLLAPRPELRAHHASAHARAGRGRRGRRPGRHAHLGRSLAEALWAAADPAELSGRAALDRRGRRELVRFRGGDPGGGAGGGAAAPGGADAPAPDRASIPAAAPRPPYSVLDKSGGWAALGRTPPHWRVNLRRMLQELARG